jgi:phosphoserine phosphatase RsbU/P
MQSRLLPPLNQELPSLGVSWYFEPCSTIGGDLFNIFQIDEDHTAFYLFDVAGHGIHAALQAFSVSRFLSPLGIREILAKTFHEGICRPVEVIRAMNTAFSKEGGESHFITITFGIINTCTGSTRYVRAGQTPLIVKENAGALLVLEAGNKPVGLFLMCEYDEQEIRLSPGDRLFLYSDGLVEACRQPTRERYGNDRFFRMINSSAKSSLPTALSEIIGDLKNWLGHDKIEDDLSLLAIEFLPGDRVR